MAAKHQLTPVFIAAFGFAAVLTALNPVWAQGKTIEVHYDKNGKMTHTTEVSAPAKIVKQPSKKLTNVSVSKVAQLVRQRAGAATLVVLWAAYCPACREFMPTVSKLARKWREKGLSVLTFDLDDSESKFRRYAKRFKGDFEMMRIRPSKKGDLKKQLKKLGLSVPGDGLPIPFFAILDKNGTPVGEQSGGAPLAKLDAIISKLLE